MSKKILILGGDGFCGWPTALFLSKHGYEVSIIDNLSRRKIDIDLGVESLTKIAPIADRIDKWYELTGKNIKFANFDIAKEYDALYSFIVDEKPDAIIHFAEQRAAPYSMIDQRTKRYTVDNNLSATHNVLCAIVESGLDIHLVHLGTMGVYGYETIGIQIPEGYLPVVIKDGSTEIEKEIYYPASPGSVYHMTKTQDALAFYFYNKNDHVRITDLHQGVVWGTNTDETLLDEMLVNRFDYDGVYGTVLNRFLMQSVIGHPLTVHGSGGQTRAFIHIRDTVKCIKIALENPPLKGERVQILNQVTETYTVADLAKLISKLTKCEIRYYKNPRKEASQNELNVSNANFLKLGLNPTKLDEKLLQEIQETVEKNKDRCNFAHIIAKSLWSKEQATDTVGASAPEENS